MRIQQGIIQRIHRKLTHGVGKTEKVKPQTKRRCHACRRRRGRFQPGNTMRLESFGDKQKHVNLRSGNLYVTSALLQAPPPLVWTIRRYFWCCECFCPENLLLCYSYMKSNVWRTLVGMFSGVWKRLVWHLMSGKGELCGQQQTLVKYHIIIILLSLRLRFLGLDLNLCWNNPSNRKETQRSINATWQLSVCSAVADLVLMANCWGG